MLQGDAGKSLFTRNLDSETKFLLYQFFANNTMVETVHCDVALTEIKRLLHGINSHGCDVVICGINRQVHRINPHGRHPKLILILVKA